jgi:hypothetical protein
MEGVPNDADVSVRDHEANDLRDLPMEDASRGPGRRPLWWAIALVVLLAAFLVVRALLL